MVSERDRDRERNVERHRLTEIETHTHTKKKTDRLIETGRQRELGLLLLTPSSSCPFTLPYYFK